MTNDKLLDVREDEIKREIELLRKSRNHIELIHCFLEWHETKQTYFIWLDDDGKERFKQGKKFRINNKTEIEPDKKYALPTGNFICRARGEGEAGPQLFLHAGEKRYLVVKKLAEGKNKRVFLCVDTLAKNNFVVLKAKGEKSGQFERFLRAGSLLGRVISHYIPQLRDVGKIWIDKEENQYQCFEYFKGKTLDQRIPLETSEAVQVFYQLALAIQDLHKSGLTHRNLTPEHVLLDEYGQIKLFGLSLMGKDTRAQLDLAAMPVDLNFTFSGGIEPPTEEGEPDTLQHTLCCELVGDYSYVPVVIKDFKTKDACAVIFLFLYALLRDKTDRDLFCRELQNPELFAKELPKYCTKDLPDKLKGVIQDVVQKIIDKKNVSSDEIVAGFGGAANFAVHNITRFDQYPMPKEEEIQIPGTDVAIWYEPLDEVGGDFYDCVALGKNRYSILVGDTMGHGLKACLYMQLISPVVQLFADQKLTPTEVLEKMDMLLFKTRRNMQGSFATACYGIFCVNEYGSYFMYSSAGHPPPLWCHQGTASYLKLESTIFAGTKLGLGPKHFNTIENFARLDGGDFLILYTDGLIEAQNPLGEPYQDFFLPKIQELVKANADAHQIVQGIREDLQKFCQRSTFEDDMTLLVIRVAL